MAESVLTLRQGVDGGFVWPIADAAGAPAVLAGCTARCQVRVREDPDAMLLAELSASVVGSTVVVGPQGRPGADGGHVAGRVLPRDGVGVDQEHVGVGPVISNGTLWKHLYTGATT